MMVRLRSPQVSLEISYQSGICKLRTEKGVRRLPMERLTAANLISEIDDLSAGKKIDQIRLRLDKAPGSRVRTIQVVTSLLAKRWQINKIAK